jgi:hypothetical protein
MTFFDPCGLAAGAEITASLSLATDIKSPFLIYFLMLVFGVAEVIFVLLAVRGVTRRTKRARAERYGRLFAARALRACPGDAVRPVRPL